MVVVKGLPCPTLQGGVQALFQQQLKEPALKVRRIIIPGIWYQSVTTLTSWYGAQKYGKMK